MSAAVTAALAPCLLDEVCSSASSKRTAERSHPGIRESDLIGSNEQIFDPSDGVISGTFFPFSMRPMVPFCSNSTSSLALSQAKRQMGLAV